MGPLNVLISGAGIGGLAAAYWLGEAGHRITLIERAQDFEARGYIVALKSAGVDITRRMGVHDALRARQLPPKRTQWVSTSGETLRTLHFSEADFNLGGYLLTTRGDLHQVLLDARPENIELRFETELAGVDQNDDRVRVKYSSGETEDYDLLIGADGVRSRTRALVFPELLEESMRGSFIAWHAQFDHGQDPDLLQIIPGRGRNIGIVPNSTTSLFLGMHQDDQCAPPPFGGTPAMWRYYLLSECADYSPTVRAAIEAIGRDDFVFADRITMVPAAGFVKGRVALLGDAGYCPTFFSGMGSAAAMLGAFCLSGALDRHASVPEALADYHQRMTPVVQRYQANARGSRAAGLTRSALRRSLSLMAMRMIPESFVERRMRRTYLTDVGVDHFA